MEFPEIKYKNKGNYYNLEEWMVFAANLGFILREKSAEEKFNIYISLPNMLMFSYYTIMGAFDRKLNETVNEEVILRFFRDLEYGDIVYYIEGGIWKKCSVIELTRGLVSENSYHLKILNHKKVVHYIPANQWGERVIISGKRNDTIVGARTIQEFTHLSQSNLQFIYPTNALQVHQLFNEPCVYISGNRTEFNNHINDIELVINRHGFTFKDFIYEGENRQFQSIKWLPKEEIVDFEDKFAPITLFMGANKALSEMQKYNQISTRLILDDRHDNTETSELLRMTIEQEIVQGHAKILTKEIHTHFLMKNISIPRGVEFVAWK